MDRRAYYNEYNRTHREQRKKSSAEQHKKPGYSAKIKKWNLNWRLRNPEHFVFTRRLNSIRQRCYNVKRKCHKDYGGRGIECCITVKDLIFLWYRDKAFSMKWPEIHRIDNNKNYTVENCQYMERSKHRQIKSLTK